MKYFTKEFYITEWLSYANRYVKKSKGAEKKDEAFYRKQYDKQCAIFVQHDRMSDIYRDPAEELRKIDEFVNEPNISDQERKRREEFKETHLYLYGDKLNRKVCPFDEEVSRRKFAENQKTRIAIYGNLPKEISDRIADIRVFALGYASEEVKQLLRPYCAELQREVKRIKDAACAETDEAESFLSERLGLNDYEDFVIMGMEEKDGDLYLYGTDQDCLVVKNGEITEGKGTPVYPYDENDPNSPWSRVVAAELHRAGEKFELHFLVSNCNEFDAEEIWELTIRGTDVRGN